MFTAAYLILKRDLYNKFQRYRNLRRYIMQMENEYYLANIPDEELEEFYTLIKQENLAGLRTYMTAMKERNVRRRKQL